MRIAVVGTGRMGSAVVEAAKATGWEVGEQFNSRRPLTAVSARRELGGAVAIVDFSVAEALEEHVKRSVEWGIPLVAGATGIGDRIENMRPVVEEGEGSVFYSPNFSIGIAILRRALRTTLALAAHFEDFDVSVHEVHHANKRDRPSGTARLLAEDIREALPWKYAVPDELANVFDLPDGPDVSSSRVGSVFGEHSVRIEGPDDQLLLQHAARSRRGFAAGALQAARWLLGRHGIYTMDDMLDDWIGVTSDTNTNHIEA